MTNTNMTISGEDLRNKLKLVRVMIRESNQTSEEQHNHASRSFAEILCMDSRDLAVGFRNTTKIRQQATRNYARLLASIILMAILDNEPGFVSTESITFLWSERQHDHLWKKFGIKRGNQTISRLDWFLQKLLIYEETAIVQWLRKSDEWTIIEYEDNDDRSDLEYDSQEKRPLISTITMTKRNKRKNRQCNLL